MPFVRTAAVVALGTVSLATWAHGGEDHSQPPAVAPVATVSSAPRAETASDEFELVAALEGGRLMLYLDRFASNEPVAGATVEVESGSFKAVASALAPGVYALPGEAFAEHRKYPLTVSLETADTADLLSLTLDHAGVSSTVATAPGSDAWTAWGASAGIVLAGIGLVAMRRRRKGHGAGK